MNIAGNKLTRRAVQLGLKGEILRTFGNDQILQIEDITEFVREQKGHLDNGRPDQLMVPMERVWNMNNPVLQQRLGIDSLIKKGNE